MAKMSGHNEVSDRILCVDLDKTFLIHDSTVLVITESLRHFTFYKLIIGCIEQGWKIFKNDLIDMVCMDNIDWQVNPEVLELIQRRREAGYEIHLVTGSGKIISEYIQSKFCCFDRIHFSTRERKLKGRFKANYLCDYFGFNNFDYVGDSFIDIWVWKNARNRLIPSKYAFKFLVLIPLLSLKTLRNFTQEL